MSETKENDQPVPNAPRERTGTTVGELEPVATAPVPPSSPALIEHSDPPPAPPRERTPSAAPEVQRVVGLPARPRLRVSYWFEGDELQCEAVLMDERRQLVRRSSVEMDSDRTVERVFTYFATRLVSDLRASGATVNVLDSSSAPAPERSSAPEGGTSEASPDASSSEPRPLASSSQPTPNGRKRRAGSPPERGAGG